MNTGEFQAIPSDERYRNRERTTEPMEVDAMEDINGRREAVEAEVVASRDLDVAARGRGDDEDNRDEASSTPHLPEQQSAQANERWQRIQANFVDDPRKAVGEAHDLVGELVQRIVDGFAKERSDLEGQWAKGENVSTEDLRVALQNYRKFFGRLLPSADAQLNR
jgi:hypothetical protein